MQTKFCIFCCYMKDGWRFYRIHIGLAIFDRVDRVNLETRPIHPIFTDLLVSIVYGTGLSAVSFEAKTTIESFTPKQNRNLSLPNR